MNFKHCLTILLLSPAIALQSPLRAQTDTNAKTRTQQPAIQQSA